MQFECKTNEDNESLMRRLSRECRDVLVKSFTLAMSDDSYYNAESTFDILTYVATNKTYIETSVKQLRKGALGKEEDVVQSADTVLDRLKGKDPEELLKEARKANQLLLSCAASKGVFDELLDVAVDIHNVYRYTKKKQEKRKKNCDDWQKVVGTEPKGSAYYAHQYMTLESINTDEQYALSFHPKLPLKQKEEILDNLIEWAEEDSGGKIATLFMDGGFYTTETIRKCMKRKKHYVIRAPKNEKTKPIIEKCSGLWCYIERDFIVGDGEDSEKTNLVVVDTEALKNRGHDLSLREKRERYYTFITDMLPSENQNTLDFCIDLAKDYGKRWGIETGYRDKIEFRGFTHSLSYSVRLFLFLLSVILYNLWRLMNKIISEHPRFFQWYRDGMTKSELSFMLVLVILEAVGIITIRR